MIPDQFLSDAARQMADDGHVDGDAMRAAAAILDDLMQIKVSGGEVTDAVIDRARADLRSLVEG